MLSRLVKYATIGISGLGISLLLIYFFVEVLKIDKHLAWLLGAAIVIFCNFILNSRYTFHDRKAVSRKHWRNRLLLYYTFTFSSTLFNYIFYAILLRLGIYYLEAAALGFLVTGFLGFYFCNFIIWKTPPPL